MRGIQKKILLIDADSWAVTIRKASNEYRLNSGALKPTELPILTTTDLTEFE